MRPLGDLVQAFGSAPTVLVLGQGAPGEVDHILAQLRPELVLDGATAEGRPVRDWCRAQLVPVMMVPALEGHGDERELRRDLLLVDIAAKLGRGMLALPGAREEAIRRAQLRGMTVVWAEREGR